MELPPIKEVVLYPEPTHCEAAMVMAEADPLVQTVRRVAKGVLGLDRVILVQVAVKLHVTPTMAMETVIPWVIGFV